MNAIATTAVQQGDWRLGWAYTDLPDPCVPLEQYGSEQEALAAAPYGRLCGGDGEAQGGPGQVAGNAARQQQLGLKNTACRARGRLERGARARPNLWNAKKEAKKAAPPE